MAWIELHDTLPDHDKVLSVAEALSVDKDLIVGKLVRLWTWALNNREDGVFKARDIQTIAEVMRYKGRVQRLVDALTAARLLDFDGEQYSIHDWDERVGMLLAKRETVRAQTRDRVRNFRKKKCVSGDQSFNVTHCNALQERYVTEDCSACNAATVPYRTNVSKDTLSPSIISPTKFVSPSVDDVLAYCRERKNDVDAQTFVDFYTAKGWKVGNQSMKDWRAAVRTWEKRGSASKQPDMPTPPRRRLN